MSMYSKQDRVMFIYSKQNRVRLAASGGRTTVKSGGLRDLANVANQIPAKVHLFSRENEKVGEIPAIVHPFRDI
ncbi:hypothetical protein PAJ34TS1_54620 [Paenibacillus azoreducens]|uniref:Uncharacterized protein n=1 Tax=Paenibacillus azoreducens TaxID=116718 RepID=A0A919YEN1_9BACL|nr:hypothetical protein J34TS1_30280 [Paenibacillus azoreducens]